MKICESSHCQGNLQFEERLIIVTKDDFLLKKGRTCFSAGMCLRIEMRYMPTGSDLQVFLQKVTCCSPSCYF